MVTHQLSDGELVVRETIPSSDVNRVRFTEIDGLRALAIILAVVYEATRLAAPNGPWQPALGRFFSDASQGLPLFFLLSGFVLAYPALATLREDGQTYLDVGRYIVKRILRIYPAYVLVLVLTFVVPPLALQYGLPALASGSYGFTAELFARNLFFIGDGLGNDGFRALALEARWYLLFPLLLLLWSRSPRIFFGLLVVAAGTDLGLAGAHAWSVGALVPFMLGIVAADIRAGHHRFERYALAVGGVALVVAVLLEHILLGLPGPLGAPGVLRVDPLWSVAWFGLLVGVGASGVLERILGFRLFRFIGAASYGTALVVVPVASFIVRQVVLSIGPAGTAANAGIVSFLAGLVIWQLADRWFADGTVRRDVAEIVGPWLNRVLRIVRADHVLLGSPLPVASIEEEPAQTVDTEFYAPPPRSNGDLAVVSMRTGSAEDLAAEILETKKRLADRSSAIFAEAEAVVAEPEPEIPAEPVLKPGFYRRPAAEKPAAAVPLPKPAGPAPAAPMPAPLASVTPAPVEPQRPIEPPVSREQPGISLSFESPAYEHYSLEPVVEPPAAAEPPTPLPPALRPVAAQPPAAPPAVTNTRGPIRMRIGALGPVPVNGNGSSNGVHRKADN
jgi:peptidoglycan/LPS O-acetylase OafA/YrhL